MNQFTPPGVTRSTRRQGSPFARARHKRQVDELIDQYVGWREASAAVSVAYERWRAAGRVDQEITFSIYSAALDREEGSALAYQGAVAQVAAAQPA